MRNAANCDITAIDSTNNIVFEQDGTKIALLGVHNLIVVRTGDALLVCDRHQAEKIKNLIGQLPAGIAMSGFAIVKRVLGVDYGQARIGLAISDELGMLAHPLETVPAQAARRSREAHRADRAREGC